MAHNRLRKIRKKISLIALFLWINLFLISGCDLLPPTQSVLPTPTATNTPLPTPTTDWFPATPTSTFIPIPSPTPMPTREGQMMGLTTLLVNDDFTDESLWTTRQSSAGNIAFGNQNLTLAVAAQSTSLLSLSQHQVPENFALEITIQTSLCEPADQVGIVFWQQSTSDFYRLMVTCSGQYRLELVQDGQNFVIYDWEPATHMQLASPATNRFGLRVYRGLFELYINDFFQFEEKIAENRCGTLGLFARTIEGNAMTVRFSDLQIYLVESD